MQLTRDGIGWGMALVTAGAMGVVGGFVAYGVWWVALEDTCHGAYECPF
jgi:hypothetical protein